MDVRTMKERFIRHKSGTKIMPGSEAWEMMVNPPKSAKPAETLKKVETHMAELDKTWRKLEGRKQPSELTEREQMLEGRIKFDPVLLKTLP